MGRGPGRAAVCLGAGAGLGIAGLKVPGAGLASPRPGHGLHTLETPRVRGKEGAGNGGPGAGAWRGNRGRLIRGRLIRSGVG
jgi:hypothetical protein